MFTFPSWSKVVVFHSHWAHNQTSEVQTIDFMMAMGDMYVVRWDSIFSLRLKSFSSSCIFLAGAELNNEHFKMNGIKSHEHMKLDCKYWYFNSEFRFPEYEHFVTILWLSLTFQMSSIEVDGNSTANVFFFFWLKHNLYLFPRNANMSIPYRKHTNISLYTVVSCLLCKQCLFKWNSKFRQIFRMKENFNFQKACGNLKVFYLHCNARNRLFCTEILK